MLQFCESFICNFMRLAHQKKIHMVSYFGFQQELQILWKGKKQNYLFWPIQLHYGKVRSRFIYFGQFSCQADSLFMSWLESSTFKMWIRILFFFFPLVVSDYRVESLHQKLPFLLLKSHILSVLRCKDDSVQIEKSVRNETF